MTGRDGRFSVSLMRFLSPEKCRGSSDASLVYLVPLAFFGQSRIVVDGD